MRRHLTVLLCASLLLSACGDDDNGGDSSAITSIPDETTSTSSTTTEPRTVAPDVIPQDESQITEEYVEQVLNELYVVSLESFIIARDAGLVEERALALIEATNSELVFEQQVNDLLALSAGNFEGMKIDPSPVNVSVVKVIDASPSCAVAEVITDPSGLMTDPAPANSGERSFVRLLAASESQLQSGLNPTAWVFDEFPVTLDGSRPQLNCDGQ
jgi:hypothetical protein